MFNIRDLNNRSIEIFRTLMEAFFLSGEPVGSRTLSKRPNINLSPATIRNVMADLEEAGLLYSPHTSAGRLPTDEGLRFFVNGLLELAEMEDVDKKTLEENCFGSKKSFPEILEEATSILSNLSQCAGVVLVPKSESSIKHVEFVRLGENRGLVVLVTEEGIVENRLIELPKDIFPSYLEKASNYLNSRLQGKTLSEAKELILSELQNHQAQIDELSAKLIRQGLAVWAGGKENNHGALIIRGQSRLLEDVHEMQELDKIKQLFDALEAKENLMRLLDASIKGDGIQIFIGAENNLFHLSGCSMIVAPYQNAQQKIIGAIGVVGSSRMNYGRIIPIVDYTSKLITKLLGS